MGARATTVGDQHPHRHDAQGAEWPSAGPRRIEVIRGSYRRPWRRWTKGNKARTTTESFAPSGTVLGMARPHGAPAGPASARPIQAPANPRLFEQRHDHNRPRGPGRRWPVRLVSAVPGRSRPHPCDAPVRRWSRRPGDAGERLA